MSKVRIILFSLLIAFSVTTAHGVEYQSVSENISRFDSQITIENSGSISIVEKINYDFGPNERHGIFRTIPLIKTNSDGKKFKLKIYDIRVEKEKFEVERTNDNLKIRIGDPDNTVTGKRFYEIRYKVDGAITYFEDHDELYWNITGIDWEIPINAVTGTISLVGVDNPDFKGVCYTGVEGSSDNQCLIQTHPETHNLEFATTADLNLGEGLTIAVSFPKNLVQVLEPQNYYNFNWIYIGLAALTSYSVFIYIIYLWIKDRLNTQKKQKIVSAWFEAPKTKDLQTFTPAETAAIVNKTANHKNLTATLIDLAQRGYFKIVAEDKKNITFIKKKDWSLDKSLRQYELDLLNQFFDNQNKSSVTYAELKKSTSLATTLPKIYKEMLKNLYTGGFFAQNPEKFDIFTICALILATILSVPTLGIPLAIFAWIIRRGALPRTDVGIEKYSEAMSLLNFLKSQEDKLDFQAHNQMFFEKLLPFATAFGVEKVWAKRFSDLQFTQNDWYQGRAGTDLNSLSVINNLSSLNRGFSAMTSTNSSSGFSSGFSGGSSGGGGGGGGGGSW